MTAKRIAAQSGEPTDLSDARKRAQIPVRTSARLRQELIDAATANDRSLTQEIEQRLERSLADDALVGGARTNRFLRRLGALIADLEDQGSGKWYENLVVFYAVKEASARLIREYLPSSEEVSEVAAAQEALNQVRARQVAQMPISENLKSLMEMGLARAQPSGIEALAFAGDEQYAEISARVLRAVEPLIEAQKKGSSLARQAADRAQQ